MATTTFSGPLRVGDAQRTQDPQVAGAVSLVATAFMADPTAAMRVHYHVYDTTFGTDGSGS